MKILVYGAGVLGSLYAARLHEAGHDVSLLARGERLNAVREHGVQLAELGSPTVRQVPVSAVDRPDGGYDVTLVFVRTHQVGAVLESLAELEGDVLFLSNWAAGPTPLQAAIGRERVLLGFCNEGGVMDGEVVRYRATSLITRLVSMPIGEPNGRTTPRQQRLVQMFRSAGFRATGEPRIDAWLKTHAAFEVPLGQAVRAAGGVTTLAHDPDAIREMILNMRENFRAVRPGLVPRAFNALRIVPKAILVPIFARFLRSSAATPLTTESPAVFAELDSLAEQMRARS